MSTDSITKTEWVKGKEGGRRWNAREAVAIKPFLSALWFWWLRSSGIDLFAVPALTQTGKSVLDGLPPMSRLFPLLHSAAPAPGRDREETGHQSHGLGAPSRAGGRARNQHPQQAFFLAKLGKET